MAYKVAGWFLRAAILGFLCLSLERFTIYKVLDHPWGMTERQRDWLFAWSILSAFLSWCGSRYCFNRGENRRPNELDRRLFGFAKWLLIGTPVTLLACGLFLPKLLPTIAQPPALQILIILVVGLFLLSIALRVALHFYKHAK